MVVRRALAVAAPFLLLALGAWAFYASPWPAILRLMLGGAHVRVVWTWRTLGLPLAAVAAWAGAIALSVRIKSGP